MDIGAEVCCFFTMRRSKAYSCFGTPAKDGDHGKIIRINELKDVTIVQFESEHGTLHAHIQNLREIGRQDLQSPA